ncbi:carboxylesterase domain-containing protein [Ophiocordyceps camponoti-floridani]|uniref:Carboxylic ester hydrolase n=1 Tax=Ophiocordyceps camponoti-floridani TaxID=2030778 RepID=A0A8H4Q679_9HYPO|nr:carboxylesterase domain-containing protein [Ophiocordyceps camponoti-floridani]
MASLAHLLLLLTASGLATASCPTVTAESGIFMGSETKLPSPDSPIVNRFLGIPFAEPPIRFQLPEPARRSRQVYNATDFKPACIQKFDGPLPNKRRIKEWFNTPPPPAGESEDCLYLNVYAPVGATQGSKAVLFWIFGGGFSFGSGTTPLYDGVSFVSNQDVVIVTINYRTNVFGFPGSPEKPRSEQNIGLYDQRLALEWVRRNIYAFGGDPHRVTLFGESAGSGSVDLLIANPPHPIPFAAAILQSGQSAISLPNHDSADSWKTLTQAADCGGPVDSLECIRALPADTIRDITERERLTFSPIYDDGSTYSPTGRLDRRRSTPQSSRIARVPMLIGSNADDGTIFVYQDERKLLKQVPSPSTSHLNRIQAAYDPPKRPALGPINGRLAAIMGDFAFDCPAKITAEESARAGIPSWRYVFDAAFANNQPFPDGGAWHSSEINLIFGTYDRTDATAYQEKLSCVMQKAWADFAKDPFRGPGWPSMPHHVAVFGAGVRPDDQGDASTPGFEVGDGMDYDGKCWLFKPIYDAATLHR